MFLNSIMISFYSLNYKSSTSFLPLSGYLRSPHWFPGASSKASACIHADFEVHLDPCPGVKANIFFRHLHPGFVGIVLQI